MYTWLNCIRWRIRRTGETSPGKIEHRASSRSSDAVLRSDHGPGQLWVIGPSGHSFCDLKPMSAAPSIPAMLVISCGMALECHKVTSL